MVAFLLTIKPRYQSQEKINLYKQPDYTVLYCITKSFENTASKVTHESRVIQQSRKKKKNKKAAL